MPRVTIYVADELKARMDKAAAQDPKPNWSEIAQAAFSLACDVRRMSMMIKGLKKSRERASNAKARRR